MKKSRIGRFSDVPRGAARYRALPVDLPVAKAADGGRSRGTEPRAIDA
jgi:hypothetical protein